ncbi:MAG: efflux RND transporter periplasmic adaptor subunit [Campylobacterales bacterium]|nr:efflux RND transporter periplasmic adaptor subunit [Campylobacterales bacterium]
MQNAEPKVVYRSAPLELRDLVTTVSATGNLEPTVSVEVGIEVSGTISEVPVDYNDVVHAGAVMARLDTTRLSLLVRSSQAALERAQANVAVAKAAQSDARSVAARLEKIALSTQGRFPSEQELEQARNAVLSADAQVKAALAQSAQAEAELETHRDNLGKAIVRAPIDGIVLDRKVEPGQTVAASMQTPILFTLAESLERMKVIVSVDEADIGEIKEGQEVLFSVDAYAGTLFTGRITQVRLNALMVSGVVTYEAVVEVPNPDLRLRPGMTASAQIVTARLEQKLCAPNAALRFTPPQQKKAQQKGPKSPSLWVLREGKAVEVGVHVSQSDGTYSVIESSELKAGDAVIVGLKAP